MLFVNRGDTKEAYSIRAGPKIYDEKKHTDHR